MSETTFSIRSAALGNERRIWVRPPREVGQAENVFIFLDGEPYRDRVGAVQVIEELGGDIADAWFVFVSMHTVEARWIECPCYRPLADFVVAELLPELQRLHPAMKASSRHTIAGLSYTGLAAAFIVHEYPGVFIRAICQSGSFWWNDCWLVRRYEELRRALPTAFYLDVGSGETQENVRHKEDVFQVVSQVDGARSFREALLRTGHELTYFEYDGGHEFAAWKRTLPGALKWALPNRKADPAGSASN
jgi:enterochelin esterase-like enzyme